jgi:hypothetical protein
MDAREEITVPEEAATRSKVELVDGVFERIGRAGVVAGVEYLVTFCADDVELSPYTAHATGAGASGEQQVLRGKDAVLGFFKGNEEKGISLHVRMRGIDVEGDTVCVRGSARVGRPDGSFAESSLSWRFHFRADGLVDEIAWTPRAG